MTRKEIIDEAQKRYFIGTTFMCAKDNEISEIDSINFKFDGDGNYYAKINGKTQNQYLYVNDSYIDEKWATIVSHEVRIPEKWCLKSSIPELTEFCNKKSNRPYNYNSLECGHNYCHFPSDDFTTSSVIELGYELITEHQFLIFYELFNSFETETELPNFCYMVKDEELIITKTINSINH